MKAKNMKDNGELPNVGILTFPIGEAGNIPLSNLVEVVYPLSNNIYVITGNKGEVHTKESSEVHIYKILEHKAVTNVFTRVSNYIYTQIRLSYKSAKLSRNMDFWIFFIGGDTLLLPMLTVKLLGGKVVLALAGSSAQVAKVQKDLLFKPLNILKKINYTLSDGIIIYTETLIKDFSLEKYRDKVFIAHEHFLNFNEFKIKKRLDKRNNLVGYVGRVSKAKGILNFVQAIPKILEKENGIKFVICGDGDLFNEINDFIDKNGLGDKVKLLGWITHEELPDYLNELKLVVLPSYTEGLPNIILEAMACGTPVLATSVGGIPDVIKDEKTGFILEDNSPECIAENVIKVFEYLNLEGIVKNAQELVEREFTYEIAVERYRKIVESVNPKFEELK